MIPSARIRRGLRPARRARPGSQEIAPPRRRRGMRGKIIAVFAVVVLVVGGLGYALTRAALSDLANPREASRALAGASAQLQLDGLVLERWLAGRGSDPNVREPFNAALASARAEAATTAANKIRAAVA